MSWMPTWFLVLPSCPRAALLPPFSALQGSQSVPPIGLQGHCSCASVANPVTICVLVLHLKRAQHHWWETRVSPPMSREFNMVMSPLAAVWRDI